MRGGSCKYYLVFFISGVILWAFVSHPEGQARHPITVALVHHQLYHRVTQGAACAHFNQHLGLLFDMRGDVYGYLAVRSRRSFTCRCSTAMGKFAGLFRLSGSDTAIS